MRYIMREDTVESEEGEWLTVYGIEAIEEESGQVMDSIPDMFFDKIKAEQFIKICNDEKLELVHLRDVVDDVLI